MSDDNQRVLELAMRRIESQDQTIVELESQIAVMGGFFEAANMIIAARVIALERIIDLTDGDGRRMREIAREALK